MKNVYLILLVFLTLNLGSCKKDLINDENGRVYVAEIIGNNMPIEGSFSITFLKNNDALIYTGSGDGKSNLGKYKIDGDFKTKGSKITVTSKGLETTNFTVASETEIFNGNGNLIFKPF